MRTGRIQHWLLAVVFLASQMIALVHATHHDLAGHGPESCLLCDVADAVPVPPSAVVVPLLAGPYDTAPAPAMAGLRDRRPFARPNMRGPPFHLA